MSQIIYYKSYPYSESKGGVELVYVDKKLSDGSISFIPKEEMSSEVQDDINFFINKKILSESDLRLRGFNRD